MKYFVNEKLKQINFLDERFYLIDEEKGLYYPSVTYILDSYPKGQRFKQFLMDYGNNARIIAERAAESGTKVHDAAHKYVTQQKVVWDDSVYNLEEWNGILKFGKFFNKYVGLSNLIASEQQIVSHKYQYAGTMDLLCRINNENWLLDIKFAKGIYTSYYMQLASYAQAVEEIQHIKIDRTAILWLKAKTRGEQKGKIQGLGWQIIEPPKPRDHYFKLFLKTYDIFKEENPVLKPKNIILPAEMCLEEEKLTPDENEVLNLAIQGV